MYTCFIAGHGPYDVIAGCDGTLQNAKQDKIGKTDKSYTSVLKRYLFIAKFPFIHLKKYCVKK